MQLFLSEVWWKRYYTDIKGVRQPDKPALMVMKAFNVKPEISVKLNLV